MPVVGPPTGSDFRDLAEEIASERSESVTTELERCREGTVIYVTSPSELATSEVLWLQRRLLRRGPRDGGFGVITGFTPAEARALYRRSSPRGSRHCLLLRKEDRDIRSPDEEATVLNRETTTVDQFRGLTDDGLVSLSSAIDGQDIHAYLSDGLLCGFPSDVDVSSYEQPLPNCVVDGDRSCPLDGELIAVDELDIGHVFLNTCASMVPSNSTTGMPVHLGIGLLASCASLVGGYRPMNGLPEEAALHYALLREGYSASERCYLLNRNSHALDLEPHPYAVFGRPGATVPEPDSGEFGVEIAADDGGVEVTCADTSAHVVDFVVPDEHIDGEGRTLLRNVNDEQSSWPLYYATFPTDGGIRVLVYSWGRIDAETLQFRLVGRDGRLSEDVAIVKDSLANLRGLNQLGLLDRKARGQLQNLRNQATGFTEVFEQQRYRANAHREVARKIDRIMDDIDAIRERLRARLDDRGAGFFYDDYKDQTIRTNAALEAEECYHCGRPVFLKTQTALDGTVQRVVGYCPYCINVVDVPTDPGDGLSYPEIRGDLWAGDVERTSVSVSFTNPADVPMVATFFPWLWSGRPEFRGAPVFEPEARTARLNPGETRSPSFEVDVSQLERDSYSVYAYVIGNLDVYLTSRKLLVLESPPP